jgi:hypothetical protein
MAMGKRVNRCADLGSCGTGIGTAESHCRLKSGVL